MAERDDPQEPDKRGKSPVKSWRAVTALFTLATVAYALKARRSHGTFLKVPFEFRVPTLQRIKERLWNPEESRVFTPRVFGIGWTLNFHRVLSLLGLVKRDGQEAARGELEEPEDESGSRNRSS
jgi:hypothetical protein